MRRLFWILLGILVLIRVVLDYSMQPVYPAGTRIRITERITSEPIRYTEKQFVTISNYKVYLPLYPEISYGDRVVVEGIVNKDKLIKPSLIEVKENRNSLYELRKNLLKIFERSLPDTHAGLISGVVLGSKANINENFWRTLKESGTAHVVVASGMNVTLVAGFLMAVLVIFMPRRWGIPIAISGVWLYALISGFDAPIIRAAFMGTIAFAAQEAGRISEAWRSLHISVALMLIIWPQWIGDIGFILSFAATASLILFKDKVLKRLKKLPIILKDDLSTSLAASFGVAPIIFFSFGQFNILSPFINAAVLWTIPLITVIGMIGGILGLIYMPIGTLVIWLTYPLTNWFVWIVNIFS